MAAKVSGYMAKFLAVVFTSIVAPVLVDLAVRDIHGEGNKATSPAPSSSAKEEPQRSTSRYTPALTPSPTGWQAPQFPHLTDTIAPSAPPSDEVDCIIVQSVGRTPEEALQNAFRAALRRAIISLVNADTFAREGQVLCERISRNSGGLIVSWKELGAKKERRLRGTVHREEVAVWLNYRLLGDRLRAAQSSNGSRSLQ